VRGQKQQIHPKKHPILEGRKIIFAVLEISLSSISSKFGQHATETARATPIKPIIRGHDFSAPHQNSPHRQPGRHDEEWEAACAHQTSALRMSQISRLTAQSGPMSRWLVALSTRAAPTTAPDGYIPQPPATPGRGGLGFRQPRGGRRAVIAGSAHRRRY